MAEPILKPGQWVRYAGEKCWLVGYTSPEFADEVHAVLEPITPTSLPDYAPLHLIEAWTMTDTETMTEKEEIGKFLAEHPEYQGIYYAAYNAGYWAAVLEMQKNLLDMQRTHPKVPFPFKQDGDRP